MQKKYQRESHPVRLYGIEYLIQINKLSIKSLIPVISVTAPFGMVIVLQGLALTGSFGTEHIVSNLLAISLIRELAPSVTAIMVAAQAGSIVASEIGAMRVKEEIDAMEIIAVKPLRYLVFPRIFAVIFACILINLFAIISGIIGGYAMMIHFSGQAPGIFWQNIYSGISPYDILGSVLKSAIFGLVIGISATWHGYHTKGGASGVGAAVNQTVVHSIIIFIIINYLLTSMIMAGR